RTQPLPGGLVNWFAEFWNTPDAVALQQQSLDAFLFLRFLRVVVFLCVVACAITWPILFPVNATGSAGQAQLDLLSYSNVGDDQHTRFYAHALVAWLVYGFVLYLVYRECTFYIALRQAVLLSPAYSRRLSSRTVLFTSVPADMLDQDRLRSVFLPAEVRRVWIAGDSKPLDDLVKKREKVALRLEAAEVKLLKIAAAERARLKKAAGSAAGSAAAAATGAAGAAAEDAEAGTATPDAYRWVPPSKRPTHRLGLLGLVGEKVDTIDWCRSELAHLLPEVDAAQRAFRAGEYKKAPAVFVEFATQADAERAVQLVPHHRALQMSPRFVGVRPDDVVWASLRMPWWHRLAARHLVFAFIATMILFWAVPVAVVGVISNVQYLETLSFLTWLKNIPD
ncbi:hypothetical protein HK405_001346, partial [Cladochytrium tenue]